MNAGSDSAESSAKTHDPRNHRCANLSISQITALFGLGQPNSYVAREAGKDEN